MREASGAVPGAGGSLDAVTAEIAGGRPVVDNSDLRSGLTIGIALGVPAAVGVGAFLGLFRSVFDTANAALVLMIVVVAVAAIGGRAAGVVASLAAVAALDFFHPKPYLSMTIDSRDDIETALLLLLVALIVGTIASWGRTGHQRL